MSDYSDVDEKFEDACDAMIESINAARKIFLEGDGDQVAFAQMVKCLTAVNNASASLVMSLMRADELARESYKRRN